MDYIEHLYQFSYEILTKPISEIHCFTQDQTGTALLLLAFSATVWAEESLTLSWIFTPLVCFASER